MGAKLVQEVASKTQDNAGDGTSTASILAQALCHTGLRNVTAGGSPVELKAGFDEAIEAVVERLKGMAEPVEDSGTIRQVATIAANNDSSIGELIAEAVEAVGQEGVITVEEAKSAETDLKVVEGMEVDKGYISPYFITDRERKEAVLENPMILITDQTINSAQDLLPSLEAGMQQKRPLLIIAKDIEGEALATLVLNVASKIVKAAAIKAPGFGDEQGELLEDIAILTGASVLAKDRALISKPKAQCHSEVLKKSFLLRIRQLSLVEKATKIRSASVLNYFVAKRKLPHQSGILRKCRSVLGR